MKIRPEANNAIQLHLENGEVLNLQEGADGHLTIYSNDKNSLKHIEVAQATLGRNSQNWETLGSSYLIKVNLVNPTDIKEVNDVNRV